VPELTIQQTLRLAKKGNELIREEFIRNHKPFIIKISSNICKRYLTWGHDDELSIALVAFNEATDSYKANDRASFYGFAKTVITRRLIDYFRKESKHQVLSLTKGPALIFLMLTLYVTLHFTFINPIELPALQSAPQDLALQSVPQAQALQPVPQALAAEPRFLSHL